MEVLTLHQGERLHLKPSARIIAVGSGKGGVGKSTVVVNIAAAMVSKGLKVGILDADIYGFTIPKMLGITERPVADKEGQITPPEKNGIKIMSMGVLANEKQPIIWRGPLIHKAIKEILTQTLWGDIDYLLIDLPPGTGDVSISLSMMVPDMSMIIVTTPQEVSSNVASRALEMAKMSDMKVLGVVENMSHHICEKCGEKAYIFGKGGGKAMAQESGVPFLGEIPLEQAVREMADKGKNPAFEEKDSPAKEAFERIADRILDL